VSAACSPASDSPASLLFPSTCRYMLDFSKISANFDQERKELRVQGRHITPVPVSHDDADEKSSNAASPSAAGASSIAELDEEEQMRQAIAASLQEQPQEQPQHQPMQRVDEEESEGDELERVLQLSRDEAATAATALTPVSAASAAPASGRKPPSASTAVGKAVRHTYELVSVVIHKGDRMSNGHYVTHIHEEDKKDKAPSTSSPDSKPDAAPAANSSSNGSKGTQPSPSTTIAAAANKRVWKKYDDSRVTRVSYSCDQTYRRAQ
jgi:hypothetical protein